MYVLCIYIHACMHASKHKQIYSHNKSSSHKHLYSNAHSLTHIHAQHTHTYVYNNSNKNTHTHTHTHTHPKIKPILQIAQTPTNAFGTMSKGELVQSAQWQQRFLMYSKLRGSKSREAHRCRGTKEAIHTQQTHPQPPLHHKRQGYRRDYMFYSLP